MLQKSIFITIFITNACKCIEEIAPEIYLTPRNFNPHPYEARYDNNARIIPNRNNGPVLFPPTQDRPSEQYYGNGISNNINEHPYASVARKKMYQSDGYLRHQVNCFIDIYTKNVDI